MNASYNNNVHLFNASIIHVRNYLNNFKWLEIEIETSNIHPNLDKLRPNISYSCHTEPDSKAWGRVLSKQKIDDISWNEVFQGYTTFTHYLSS